MTPWRFRDIMKFLTRDIASLPHLARAESGGAIVLAAGKKGSAASSYPTP